VVVQKHIGDGIESLEQITEAINGGTENIKEHYMNNSEQQGQREHRNINDNVSQGTNDGKLWNGRYVCT
jgi:hypothetical protein